MGDLSNEPSMEEILSSIKRIINEDSEAQLAQTARKPRSIGSAARAQTDANANADEEPEVLELTEIADSPEPKQKTSKAVASPPAAETSDKQTLVSDAATDASRASLAALSALVVQPEVHGSDTLEGLVRAMLKPALAEWLDARLPEIVERMVAQEIRRITDRN
jgi:uncharacterized protein